MIRKATPKEISEAKARVVKARQDKRERERQENIMMFTSAIENLNRNKQGEN